MLALKRYPWKRRRAVAREWNRRSQEAKARLRMERGERFEDAVARAKMDRRGTVLHHGLLYRGDGRVQTWQVRHAVAGRVDQFEIVLDGAVWKRGGPRKIARWMPGLHI